MNDDIAKQVNKRTIDSSDLQAGRVSPWIIYNHDTVARKTVRSLFEDNGTAIPKEIRYFFEADNMSLDDIVNITLIYKDNEYKAYIKKEAAWQRTRMFWRSDLSRAFKEYFDTVDKYPVLFFERYGKGTFKIWFSEDNLITVEPLDNNYSFEEQTNHAKSMDEKTLLSAAIKRGVEKPKEKEVFVRQYVRDPYVAEYAKRRADGYCMLCGKPAPFNDSNGRPYLESHHVVWISQGGKDTVDNCVALCPNCHRKMHIVANDSEIQHLKRVASMEEAKKK